MPFISNKYDAIIVLHDKGFTEDFIITENRLLWIQQKIHVRIEDVVIIEHYCFKDLFGKDLRVFGVMVTGYAAKGIIVNYKTKAFK